MDPRLEEASYNGDLDALHQLLQEDRFLLEQLSTTPRVPNNPLHIASMRGHADFAREILLRKPELAKDLNARGFSALHLAAANGHLAVVRELWRELGSDICLVRDKDGMLPIHTAAMKGRVDVLRQLLDACPESALRTTSLGEETILHLGVRERRSEAVRFLVERLDSGELLNAKDERGNTILHLAAASKQLEILMFLLSKREIDVNYVNLRGFTPLDVLLESPRAYGEDVLAEMIRKAGGIETAQKNLQQTQSSPEELQQLQTQSGSGPEELQQLQTQSGPEELQQLQTQSGPEEPQPSAPPIDTNPRTYLDRIREFFQPSNGENSTGTLMVVATVITTITFQAGLNPPGGFRQDDGKAVLGDKLSLFFKYDMVGLFTSLSIILVLICATPRRKGMVLKFLVYILWVSIFSTALAFLMAVFKIFPESNHPTVLIFLKGWLWIFRIAIVWVAIRFITCLLKKVGWLKIKEEDRESQELSNPIEIGGSVTATRIAALLLVIVIAAAVVFVCLVIFPILLSSVGLSHSPETPQPPSPPAHYAPAPGYDYPTAAHHPTVLIWIFIIAIVWVSIRFAMYLLRKVGLLKMKEEDVESQEMRLESIPDRSHSFVGDPEVESWSLSHPKNENITGTLMVDIILRLICVTPRRKMGLLVFCIIWVFIFAIAFLIAVLEIYPESNHPTVRIFLKGWLWIFRIAVIWADMILMLICVIPQRKKMVLEFLVCIMWVFIFSTALSNLITVFEIFPESNHPKLLIFLKGWLWIFRIAIIWADIRFTMCLLRKEEYWEPLPQELQLSYR